MVVDPKQPGDPGDRDASLAKLKSLRRHSLIDRRHNRVAKLNNQRQGGRGSRPLRSRPPFPAGGRAGRRPAPHRARIPKRLEVQRILAEVHGISERQRRWPRRVRIVSVEAVAEKWLVPRLVTFKAAHPGVALELETNHRGVDPDRRDFDAWFAYTGETATPRAVTSREDTLLEETLYEEDLLPVWSPALLAAPGRPDGPADLDDGPLLSSGPPGPSGSQEVPRIHG